MYLLLLKCLIPLLYRIPSYFMYLWGILFRVLNTEKNEYFKYVLRRTSSYFI